MKKERINMDLTTLETVLLAIAPSLASIITCIGSVIKICVTKNKKIAEEKEIAKKEREKSIRLSNDIAKIKAKLESIEKVLIETKERK